MRRRTVFATPFVMVLGCSTPAEKGPSEPVKPVARASDAAVQDAAEISADLPAQDKCLDPKRPGYNRCNPPAPVPPAKVIVEGDVVQQSIRDRNRIAVVRLERDAAVQKTWSAQFVDGNGAVSGTCTITSVQHRNVTCELADTRELPSRRVRITEVGGEP